MVYFIQAGEGGPIKIGYARDLGATLDRCASLQTGNPTKLVLRASMRGTRDDEARLHTLFAEDRLEGEWFKPSLLLWALIFGASHLAEFTEVAQTELGKGMLAHAARLTAVQECIAQASEPTPEFAELVEGWDRRLIRWTELA